MFNKVFPNIQINDDFEEKCISSKTSWKVILLVTIAHLVEEGRDVVVASVRQQPVS